MNLEIPDVPETIIGWRAWTLKSRLIHKPWYRNIFGPSRNKLPKVEYHLRGSFGHNWTSKRLEAECEARTIVYDAEGAPPPHKQPMQVPRRDTMWLMRSHDLCVGSCGIYAYKNPSLILDSTGLYNDGTMVIGTTYLSGRVFEHRAGYRAQYGTIQKLYVLCIWQDHEEAPGYWGHSYDKIREGLETTFQVPVLGLRELALELLTDPTRAHARANILRSIEQAQDKEYSDKLGLHRPARYLDALRMLRRETMAIEAKRILGDH